MNLDQISENPGEIQTVLIDDANSPLLDSYQDLMERTFPPSELDSIEITQGALEDNEGPNRRADFILIVTTEDEKVIGAMNAAYIPAHDENGLELGWGSVVVNYIVSDPAYQGRGIAKSLYAELDKQVREIAKKRGNEEVKYVVGETVPTVEGLVNKTGRARLYFERFGQMVEVKYFQAPLEFDKDGNPLDEEVPLHLMACPTNGEKKIKKGDLLRVVDGIYDYNSRENALATCTPEGYKKACAKIDEVLAELKEQLEGVSEVTMITQKEREAMKEKGVIFDEQAA